MQQIVVRFLYSGRELELLISTIEELGTNIAENLLPEGAEFRCMAEIEWKVDSENYTREEATEILDQVEKQVEQQTGESLQRWEAEELEPGSGAILISFIIGVSSKVVAQAIYDALKEQEETEDVNFDVDVSGDGDPEIEINIEK